MGRTECGMCLCVGAKVYCSFYDLMNRECSDVTDCPEGLDEVIEDEGDGNFEMDDDFYDSNSTHI